MPEGLVSLGGVQFPKRLRGGTHLTQPIFTCLRMRNPNASLWLCLAALLEL